MFCYGMVRDLRGCASGGDKPIQKGAFGRVRGGPASLSCMLMGEQQVDGHEQQAQKDGNINTNGRSRCHCVRAAQTGSAPTKTAVCGCGSSFRQRQRSASASLGSRQAWQKASFVKRETKTTLAEECVFERDRLLAALPRLGVCCCRDGEFLCSFSEFSHRLFLASAFFFFFFSFIFAPQLKNSRLSRAGAALATIPAVTCPQQRSGQFFSSSSVNARLPTVAPPLEQRAPHIKPCELERHLHSLS